MSVNNNIKREVTPELMQFGHALPRIILVIWEAYLAEVPVRIPTLDVTDPSARYASQITWIIRGKACPNCINYGVTSLLIVLLTLSVPSLGFS